MPYKAPAEKAPKGNRTRRTKKRAARSATVGINDRPLALNPETDPVAGQEAKNGWKLLLGLAAGFAGALLGAFSGMRFDKRR